MHINEYFTKLTILVFTRSEINGMRSDLCFLCISFSSERKFPSLCNVSVNNSLGDFYNVIRFTGDGGVLIGCRRRQGKTWVEVWDTGIGIPADKFAEIFEEFRQLDHDERNRGSGLGLAIVAKTASLLGLEIRVQSRPGKGSMFALELPLSVEETLAAQSEFKNDVLRIALMVSGIR